MPEGWKIRSHQWWCQKRNSHRIHYEFLSPQNEFFKSRKAVVEHMTADGQYTVEQIDMVKNATQPQNNGQGDKNKRRMTSVITSVPSSVSSMYVSGGVSGTVAAAASTTTLSPPPSSSTNPVFGSGRDFANSLVGWKAGNPTLPQGWRMKKHEFANQTVWFYMSPTSEIIKSRRGVIEHMFDEGGYTDKDFSIVINGGKQRKSMLHEFYEDKINRRCTLKKRKRLSGIRTVGSDDPDLEELDIVDSDDNLGEDDQCTTESTKMQINQQQPTTFMATATNSANGGKKPKNEKELIQPTRRSGRVQKRKRLGSSEDENGDDAENDIDNHELDFKKMRPIKFENMGKLNFTHTTFAADGSQQQLQQQHGNNSVFLKQEIKSDPEVVEVSSGGGVGVGTVSPMVSGGVIHIEEDDEDTLVPAQSPHQLPDSQGSELIQHNHHQVGGVGSSILMSTADLSSAGHHMADLDTFEVVSKTGGVITSAGGVITSVGNLVSSAGGGVIVSGTGGLLDGARLVNVSNANSYGGPGTSNVVVSTADGPRVVTMLTDLVSTVAD